MTAPTQSVPPPDPYRDAIAARVRAGIRWGALGERDVERLCLVYAMQHCEDTLLDLRRERRIWTFAGLALADHLIYTGADTERGMRAASRQARRAGELAQLLADRAVEQCERFVGEDYRNAWDELHADAPDEQPPVMGR